jgi:hypothetical protein
MKNAGMLTALIVVVFVLAGAIAQQSPPGPSLNSPDCIRVPEARAELPGDEVLGVGRNGEYCAYPLRMMAFHRVVNDHLGGPPILVAYDPDAGMGQVYDPVIDKKEHNFDSAGLRGGIPILKDRETGSIWSIATGEAIDGPSKGKRMARIPSWIITWKRFSELHPDAYVLKEDAKQSVHYVARVTAPTCPIPASIQEKPDKRLRADELVFGLEAPRGEFAITLSTFARAGRIWSIDNLVVFYDGIGKAAGAYAAEAKGRKLTFSVVEKYGTRLFKDKETGSLWNIEGAAVEGALKGTSLASVPSSRSRWFAWSSVFPRTRLVKSGR